MKIQYRTLKNERCHTVIFFSVNGFLKSMNPERDGALKVHIVLHTTKHGNTYLKRKCWKTLLEEKNSK